VAQVPPIVSQDQFDRVQSRLKQNQKFASRHNRAHAYLLRALVSCGVCGLACTGRTHVQYSYYVCRGKNSAVQSCRDEWCPARFIPAHQLDALVWQDICELLEHPDLIAHALQRAQGGAWLPQELQARRDHLRKATRSLQQQQERLTEAYLAGVLELEEYRRRKQDLTQRVEAVESQERQLEASVHRQSELTGMVESIQDWCHRVQQGLKEASFEQKRQLVELLIDRVVVTNGEVEIRYVIPTSSKSEQVRFCHLRSDYFNPRSHGIPSDLCSLRGEIGEDRPGMLIARFPLQQQGAVQAALLLLKTVNLSLPAGALLRDPPAQPVKRLGPRWSSFHLQVDA
jgi:site-specific DNA recombinase